MVSLIDTDVMIDASRANANAASYLDSLNDPAISIVTAQELIVGARDKRDLAGIDSLVSAYPVIGCLTILGVPAEIGHSEDCVPLPYGRGSECWY